MAEYIERDKVLEIIKGTIEEAEANCISSIHVCAEDFVDGWVCGLEAVESDIKDIPAADVRPVVHGHWNIGYFHDRVCSCCLHPDNDLNDYAHDFCPNCGAKMDGKDGESDG